MAIFENPFILFYSLFLGASFLIALYDFAFYKIPNVLLLIILVLFLAKAFVTFSFAALFNPFVAFTSLLCGGFVLYMGKIFGAGDAKFLAFSGLWMAEINLMRFLVLAGLFAGIVSLIYFVWGEPIEGLRKKLWSRTMSLCRESSRWGRFLGKYLDQPFFPNTVCDIRKAPVPLGVPICVACFIVTLRAMGR